MKSRKNSNKRYRREDKDRGIQDSEVWTLLTVEPEPHNPYGKEGSERNESMTSKDKE